MQVVILPVHPRGWKIAPQKTGLSQVIGVVTMLFYIKFFLYNRPIYQNKQEPSCEYPKKRSPLMMCC
jgi:hypothetical protein